MNYITIDDFEQLTLQQLFDISAKHILSTGKKSFVKRQLGESGSSCTYSGSGCAAAPFIRPECREEADKNTDGTSWAMLRHSRLVPEKHTSLVSDLQSCHDNNSEGTSFITDWKLSMTNIARKWDLNTDVLN